jgi:hypothetical protein
MSSSELTTIRGFAWFAFPDPGGDAGACHGLPFATLPAPAHCWWVEGTECGIRNPIWGDTYLIVTAAPDPPRLAPGWSIEPADLDETFESEGGEVQLARTFSVRRTPWGIVQECEFAALVGSDLIDRASPHHQAMRDPDPAALFGRPPGSLPGFLDSRN